MKLSWANRITLTRIFMILPFVIFMLKMGEAEYGDIMRYSALAVFIYMALSDVVDGYLARVKNQATKLGAFLDPTADKLLMICACLLLASERASVAGFKLPVTVVVLIIGKDVFLTLGFAIVFFITNYVRIVPVWSGKLATFVQLSMVAGILIGPEASGVFPWWIWLLRILWWGAGGLAILSTLIYIVNGSRYIEEFEQESLSREAKER